MKIVSFKKNCFSQLATKKNCLVLIAIIAVVQTNAQRSGWLTDSSVHLIDGQNAVYSNVNAGDTIYLKAGLRDKLLIRNFKGGAAKPITFMNKDGAVIISTNAYYGISILNCRNIRLCGEGASDNFYGIQIKKVLDGSGIGIGNMSSDFEIDHVSIENCRNSGIFAKTDPDCTLKATRDSFTQFNTHIHDNYIAGVGNEGMYIGSSFYAGYKIQCNGKDTVVLPPVLNNVKIYNNVVKQTGWDGIQVSSAPLHCQVFNNTVLDDSQAEVQNQMSGILLGGGSRCDCYNNMIANGKGDGIENHGLGSNKIYNNIIVNAGQTYYPGDASKMKHGIFVSDASILKDSALYILFNDIINPKSDGIRFQSVKSRHNIIASNLIINPGNYNLYETDNTSFAGKDAYVMVPNAAADIQLKNNYFTQILSAAGISPTDYSILPGSPLINNGCADNHSITIDFNNNRRPVGGLFDIGAMEYSKGSDTLLNAFNQKPVLFPNPVQSTVTIRYLSAESSKSTFRIYSFTGAMIAAQINPSHLPGIQQFTFNAGKLLSGTYIYAIQNGQSTSYGKFIKL